MKIWELVNLLRVRLLLVVHRKQSVRRGIIARMGLIWSSTALIPGQTQVPLNVLNVIICPLKTQHIPPQVGQVPTVRGNVMTALE